VIVKRKGYSYVYPIALFRVELDFPEKTFFQVITELSKLSPPIFLLIIRVPLETLNYSSILRVSIWWLRASPYHSPSLYTGPITQPAGIISRAESIALARDLANTFQRPMPPFGVVNVTV